MHRFKIIVNTARYVLVHGHKPRDGRSWWFRLSGSRTYESSTVGFSGRYRAAARQAKHAAKQLGHQHISLVA